MNSEKVKLSAVISNLESGSRPKGGVSINGDVPSLGAEHLNSDGGFKFDKLKKVPYEYYNSMKNGKIERRDILIVKDGATTGKVSYVKSNFPFEEASINEHLFRLKINLQVADPKYVFYYLKSTIGNRQIMKDFRGATVGGISRSFTEKVQIPLPPLETQRKIAAILDKADELVQNDKKTLKKYDQLAQSVFLEMFGDPVMNQKCWEINYLAKCVSINGGGTPSKSKPRYFKGDIPWISPKDMKSQFIISSQDKITEEAVLNSSTKMISKDSVLMVVRSGILKKSLPIAINLVPVTVNQDMKVFGCYDMINPYFLMYQLMIQSSVLLSTIRGTTADNISTDVLKKVKLILPPINKQRSFELIVKHIETQKQLARQSLQKSEELFLSLLQGAFRGDGLKKS